MLSGGSRVDCELPAFDRGAEASVPSECDKTVSTRCRTAIIESIFAGESHDFSEELQKVRRWPFAVVRPGSSTAQFRSGLGAGGGGDALGHGHGRFGGGSTSGSDFYQ